MISYEFCCENLCVKMPLIFFHNGGVFWSKTKNCRAILCFHFDTEAFAMEMKSSILNFAFYKVHGW